MRLHHALPLPAFVALLLACGAPASAPPHTEATPAASAVPAADAGATPVTASVDELKARLSSVADDQAEKDKVVLTPAAREMLGQLIADGATKLHDSGPTTDSVSKASDAMRKFIDASAGEAHCAGCRGADVDVVHERTARGKVCPLFPFC